MFCKVCFNEIKDMGINALSKNNCICQKCFNEFNPKFYKFKIEGCEGLSIFDYDETIRKHLFTLKGAFDIELAPIFISRFIYQLSIKYRGYILVPFPSNKEDDERRGFNHVVEIFKNLKLPLVDCLEKKEYFKQSDLSKEERLNISKKIKEKNLELLEGKKVLIIDDVMTTGSSIKSAINIIKKGHPKKIKVLVLSRKVDCNRNKANCFSLFLNSKRRY